MARIAVVDDLDFNRDLVAALLRPAGHDIVEAADGAAALEMVRRERPELIVCDVLMPVMDGYEFVRRLRSDPVCGEYGARVPVIFWSAYYNEDEALHLAAECGVSLLLPKPCPPERLQAVIRQALSEQPPPPLPLPDETGFEGQHRRLLTDKLSEQTTALLRANARLTALLGMVLALGSEHDPQRLLAAACRGARELLGASDAWLVYREDDSAPVRSVSDGPHSALPAPAGFGGSSSQPQDPRFGAVLVAPLSSMRTCRGWLMIARLPGEAPFEDEDEHLLGLLAAQTLHAWEIERLNGQLSAHAAALEDEVAERERITRQLDVQYAIARQLAGAQGIDAVLPVLLRTLGERLGFEIAALWLPDARHGGLRCEQVWAAPGSAHLGCAAARIHRRLAPEKGQPGRSRLQRRPLWSLDLHRDEDSGRDPDCPDLHACATLPIAAGERIVAVFELLAGERRPPDPGLLDLMWAIGEQVGQFWARIDQQHRNARLARVHAVLSGINGALVRIHERAALLRATCRIAVEQGEFGIAWIGDYDAAAARVTPVAWAGIDDGFGAQALALASSDDDYAALIVREAIHRREAVWCNDLAAEAAPVHSRFAEAQRRGFGSLIVLPLVVDHRIGGVLALYTQAPDYFTREERELLEQVASDIAFGLADIDRRDRLDYLNHYDPLTGLPNRTLWRERLGHALIESARHHERTAVLVLDIARFRHVNNGFGRAAGDALLRALAERAAAVWPEPAHVGRLGADCFAGFLPRLADVQAITQLLEGRLGAALSAPFPVDGHELRPGFVAGIAIAPDDGDEAETLLHHAEAALAQAKASDRPYVYYRPELTSGIAGTLRLENRLHRALERGEFELHYQPRADARSGRLTGLEALLRWRDPEAGLVAPLRFVPVLERLGLINAAGEWAIRRALADSRRWTAVAGPLRVAVNVSAVQLREPGLGDTICSALAEAPPDGAPLDLEITESVLMSQVEVHGQMLASLRRRGVGIAIDDFGTGYSSLAYLSRLPVDALKIDRSFVETLTDRPESLAIVRTVISLAQSLHLKTVAEGVETAEQAGRLAELGCDELQGFWISRPLPLDALLDWLRARTPAGV